MEDRRTILKKGGRDDADERLLAEAPIYQTVPNTWRFLGEDFDEFDVYDEETVRGLMAEARKQGRREGFEAAREGLYENGMEHYNADEETYAVLDGHFKYASLEHYERSLK